MAKFISIKGAKVHNLKDVSLKIPRDKLVVITGLSGSGKSSLAFDTLYAEGQRRYVESLSAYARQFLGLMEKPDVEQIDGLSPAISIDQKSASRNPRSTVGTITEIYDYLRLLYARAGRPHCPVCGKQVDKQSIQQIVKNIQKLPAGTKINLLAPLIKDKKGEHKNTLQEIRKAGYARVRINNVVYPIEEAEDLNLDKQKKHTIDVLVDRLAITKTGGSVRIQDSVETALDLGDGTVILQNTDTEEEKLYSEHFACLDCGINLPEIQPRTFSFNSPHGACPDCTGLGTKLEVDPDLVMPNKNLTINQGAIRPWSSTASRQTWYQRMLEAVAADNKISLDKPVKDLSKKELDIILYGSGNKYYNLKNETGRGKVMEYTTSYEGVVTNLKRRYKDTDSDYMRREIESYMKIMKCPTCQGKKLKPEALSVKVADETIDKVTSLTVEEAIVFFNNLKNPKKSKLNEREKTIAKQILKEICDRLSFLRNVGLDYITIDRNASTLSGGEAQRIRLATQIGSQLVGVVYILDEPSIGLHQRDNKRLIKALKDLRDLGNTIIVVEHDEEMIESADIVIDVGPGAGKKGGKIVFQGTPAQIRKSLKSITGRYLSGKESIPIPEKFRNGTAKKLTIHKASEFNLQDVTVDFPLGKFVCVSGVSGSGKSTLVTEILSKALAKKFYKAKDEPGEHKEITGTENLDKVITIDQSPIGRTPRSNPATYTGVFTHIRDLFVQVPESKMRGYKAGRFSFNVKGGRCEACQGDGVVKIEMHFLPDVYVECQECKGRRYNEQALEIHYKGKDIAEVLQMNVDEALVFFQNISAIRQKLQILSDVGLGYIELGQSAITLSGGEAQRVKLATELSRRATGKTLYILDEPTTGLHFEDVKRLLEVLHRLVDKGNSVLIIEHNLDVIKSVDYIIDLGPEGGDKGGLVVATGTPAEVAQNKKSITGKFLQKYYRE
ncbi:MAG: excinuclease ABC subunit UvrA [bacterium]